jgi:hypothetical protein
MLLDPKIKQIDILFSTQHLNIQLTVNSLYDKIFKQNALRNYLTEYSFPDNVHLAVIEKMDPTLARVARSIHSRLIDYEFYEIDDGNMRVSSVEIMSPYTLLVRLESYDDVPF